MSDEHTLTITARLENLDEIRDFVRATADALDLPAPIARHLLLVVDEAATNVVEHGYGGQPGPLEIRIARSGPDVIVRLRDRAPVFDPTGVAPPDLATPLEDRDPGRLGVFFMREFMDEITHRARPGGGNELVMRKRLA